MNFINLFQKKYNEANIIEKLIFVNILIFMITAFFGVFQGLYNGETNLLIDWFSLESNTDTLFDKPWSIISYGFLHANFVHILINLIVLYYIGTLFIEYFNQKQLLTFYVFGTIFGGLLFVFSQNYFPVFKGEDSVIVGASAGISAIFIGIASHMPNYQLKFRFIGFIKLWHLAGIWILIDVVGLISNNAGGHFSHLGGALFGLLYLNSSSKKNQNISNWFSTLYKVRNNPLKTVYKSGKKKEPKTTNTSLNQKQINTILDKISKSGYDTLSKVEKDFLFKQGKR